MELGIDAEKETLQSLIRSCLLELNDLKLDLTKLEVERANDNTPLRIKELEKDIVEKEKEVSVIKFKAEDEINLLKIRKTGSMNWIMSTILLMKSKNISLNS